MALLYPADYDPIIYHEAQEVFDTYFEATGNKPAPSDLYHNAWRRMVEGWTHANILHAIRGEPLDGGQPGGEPAPPAPPAPPPIPTRTGLVRALGRALADDGGAFLPFGESLFWAAWGYKFDRERLTKNLDWLASRGVTHVRALGQVGPRFWEDRTIDPNWSDYEDVIAGTTDLCYSRGLRVEWTIFGGADMLQPIQIDRVVDQFLGVLQGREQKVAYLEVANEAWQTGFPGDSGAQQLRRIAQKLQDRSPFLVGVTSPQDNGPDGIDRYYGGDVGSLVTLHLDRSADGTGGIWRPVRQPWDYIFRDSRPASSDEPIGPQSSVREDDSPLRLAMSAAIAWLCLGSYVLHASPGIWGGGQAGRDRGHPADFWKLPNGNKIVNAIRTVRDLLPPDLTTWNKANGNSSYRSVYPFEVDDVERASGDGRMLRAYAGTSGSKFVIFPIQLKGSVKFVAKQKTDVRVLHPLTGAEVTAKTLNRGQALVLNTAGLPDDDGAAAIITGTLK